jgi:hypothetical protein
MASPKSAPELVVSPGSLLSQAKDSLWSVELFRTECPGGRTGLDEPTIIEGLRRRKDRVLVRGEWVDEDGLGQPVQSGVAVAISEGEAKA